MSNEPTENLFESSENLGSEIVIIKVGEEPNIKEFEVPFNILSEKLPYFEVALSPRWARRENGNLVFNKPNISPLVFEVLINYTETFSDKNDVSLLEIFIAADEMGVLEIRQQVERRLLVVGSAWNLPKDFITMCKYNDAFPKLYVSALKFMRNKVREYLTQGKFLKALEFEEILENNHHSSNDQTSALSWDLSGYKYELKNLNELSIVLNRDTLLTLNLAFKNLGFE
ncbi:BTB-domain-containing protein [Gigaspora margarita]|uniref:BTB-domain-containing protein n=1 Tax=Gigaspora margarita TaxID=4874 RepID=A0A8H4EL07_GIGMA|nr:BTB-domain-containing protein [Gigaspora margarita]